MRVKLTRRGVFAVAVIGLAACADRSRTANGPTLPAPQVANAANGRHLGEVPFACTVYRLQGVQWETRDVRAFFPRAELPDGGGMLHYRYVDPHGSRLAVCEIPNTGRALRRMNRLFGADGAPVSFSRGGTDAGPRILGCVAEQECQVEGITATVSPTTREVTTWTECVYATECTSSSSGGGLIGGGGGSGGGEWGTVEPSPEEGEPTPEEEEDATSCPSVLTGKVITALIPVAGRSHTFRFDGPMIRGANFRSPATYAISHPTASEDTWWMAESGTIQVNCRGIYTPSVNGVRRWIGIASYAGRSDLHMVMGPGHPSFDPSSVPGTEEGTRMAAAERNVLSIITEDELAAGLAILSTPENAREVAAQVYAIPPEEQVHFDWIATALHQVACVSEELAKRIRDALGRTPEERARIQADQETFCTAIAPVIGRGMAGIVLSDVVFDRRREAEQEEDWE